MVHSYKKKNHMHPSVIKKINMGNSTNQRIEEKNRRNRFSQMNLVPSSLCLHYFHKTRFLQNVLKADCASGPNRNLKKYLLINIKGSTIVLYVKKILTILRIAPQMAYVLNWPFTLPVTLSTCNDK